MIQDQQCAIQVNGLGRSIPAGTTLRAIVEDVVGRTLRPDGTPYDDSRLAVAAAVSGTVVPRGQWHSTVLPEGAQVDVVTAAQGG